MSNPPVLPEITLSPPPEGSKVHGKGMRWFELGLVLMISVGSSAVSSVVRSTRQLPAVGHVESWRWILGCARLLVCLLLLLYVLRRRGLGFRSLGLRWSWRDLGTGVLLAIVAQSAYGIALPIVSWLLMAAFGTVGIRNSSMQIFGNFTLAAVPYYLLSPIFEELIVRAYLMTELIDLTGSATLAVVASSILQASYHLYYGWSVALSMFFTFLTFAIYFALWRRALPVIVAHEVLDIVVVIRKLLP
jgi:membrane protease YdiL (CAAX protease family)